MYGLGEIWGALNPLLYLIPVVMTVDPRHFYPQTLFAGVRRRPVDVR